MNKVDRRPAHLADMLLAARDVVEVMAGCRFVEYERDKLNRYAIERLMMIIGEASKRLDDEFKADNPQIAWVKMKGMRNVLAHEYGEIVNEKVYFGATVEVPLLIAELEKLLPDPL
jgi:uncharacterized protein with HEPN domain